jgi:hypothetical protein
VTFSKIIIRKFLKHFKKRYGWKNKYWRYFEIEKDFHLKIIQNFEKLIKEKFNL